MSKAIAGAAMIGAAIGIGVLIFFQPELLVAVPYITQAMFAIGIGGVSMEAGAIADALTANRGQNITTRQAAGLRQIVYSMQRVGGVTIYQSTTGSHFDQYNYIIVWATHTLDSFVNLYLDGRQVFWKQDGQIANVGCGSVAATGGTPATATATIAGGSVTGITATGGTGYANVKPTRYRVVLRGGGGSGAAAYATNSGTPSAPVWTVFVTAGGNSYTSAPSVEIQGAYTFGGNAANDQQDPSQPGYGIGYGIGPGGPHYQFDSLVYAEVRFGDQLDGDFMTSIQANDPTWGPSAQGTPWVGGCAYMYLKVEYDQAMFPSAPEIRATLTGKNDIYDPRTGEEGYTSNWALICADIINDPTYGLGDDSVNEEQLIAAANVCDEQVLTSQGYESNFPAAVHYDTSTSPGDALQMLMPAAAGRISRIGGEWFLWPAYWQGPSFSFDESALIDTPTWTPKRSFKDLFNRVTGTYIAPNFPYNCAGNLYDKNGFYYGETDDVWPMAWQPTNYPQYAQDTLHGYESDVWLAQDGGVQLPKEIIQRGVISIVQAQRLAKINLLRNRFQGMGTFPMQLACFQMQPTSVMEFTWALFGWTDKTLEMGNMRFMVDDKSAGGEDGGSGEQAPRLYVQFDVNETDISVYEWSTSEELTPYDVPADGVGAAPYLLATPTALTLASSSSTAITGADGIVTPRLLVTWADPADVRAIAVQGQYRLNGATDWTDAGYIAIGVQQGYMPIVSGQAYDVQVRSVRPNGTTSAWVQQLNFTTGSGVVSNISAAAVAGLSPVATGGMLAATKVSGGILAASVLPAAVAQLAAAGAATPTIAAGAAAQVGSGAPTPTISGTDQTGEIDLTTGTGSLAGGTICTVTWGALHGAAPKGVCTVNGVALPDLEWTTTTTTLVLSVTTPLAPSTAYKIGYSFA